VAAWSKAYYLCRLVARIAGSNSTDSMDVCLWSLYVVLCRQKPLRWNDHWVRGVLRVCVCVCVCVCKKPEHRGEHGSTWAVGPKEKLHEAGILTVQYHFKTAPLLAVRLISSTISQPISFSTYFNIIFSFSFRSSKWSLLFTFFDQNFARYTLLISPMSATYPAISAMILSGAEYKFLSCGLSLPSAYVHIRPSVRPSNCSTAQIRSWPPFFFEVS
jgi:hypothetical protein